MSQVEVDKIIPQSGTTLTIGDSGDTITVASGATLTGDLNADNLTSGTVPSARISGAYTGITQTGTLASFASTGIDDNATSTAITIDSSGNLLLDKTTTSNTTAGVRLGVGGVVAPSRTSDAPIVASRLSTDGKVIEIRKDATLVGTIGAKSSKPYFGSTGSGATSITFGSDKLILSNQDGVIQDNSRDIGSSSERIKDLYLGGGLYVGGTGTANKLDDYEEGTWTPSYGFSSGSVTMDNQEGHYVKIGKLVIATVGMSTSALSSPSGQARIDGLPFTKEATSESGFSNGLVYRWGTDFNNFGTLVIDNTSYAFMYTSGFNIVNTFSVQGSDFADDGAGGMRNRITGVITYYTTS